MDGASYGEPLIYSGLVYAVTENDSVYAINEFTGGIVWRENLGTPVPGNTLPCGDIDPSVITSTPMIDPAANEIFVVAYLYPPQHHVLFALNLQTGSIVFQRIVDSPGVSPLVEQQRGALELANHTIYIPYGGLAGDCAQYHGYVLGVHEDNSSATLSYAVPSCTGSRHLGSVGSVDRFHGSLCRLPETAARIPRLISAMRSSIFPSG